MLQQIRRDPLKDDCWDFPGGPVVKKLPSNAGGVGSNPDWETKIPHAMQSGQKRKNHFTFPDDWLVKFYLIAEGTNASQGGEARELAVDWKFFKKTIGNPPCFVNLEHHNAIR